MHIKSLKIYCDVVDRRSFSRAADDNGISQSSVSQAVHQLEDRLGVQFFDRSKRPFVLTREGERYYDGCRQLVRQYAQLEEDVRTLHDEASRRLLVASIYSAGLAHISAMMQRFSEQFPKAQVRLEYLHPDEVYEVVEAGDVDLGVISYPEDSRTLTAVPWKKDRFVVVCHPQHRLAQQHNASGPTNPPQSISLSSLADESFVAFESGLRIRTEVDRALLVAKTNVEVVMEFDNIETIKRAIEINEGISLLPEPSVAQEIALGTLVKVLLKGNPLQRPLGIVHRRDRQLNGIAHDFVEQLQAEIVHTNASSNGHPSGTFSTIK